MCFFFFNFLCFVGFVVEMFKVFILVYIFIWMFILNFYYINRILERDYLNLYVYIFIFCKIEFFKDNVWEKFLVWNVYLFFVYLRMSLCNVNFYKRSIYEFNWMVFLLNLLDVNFINFSWNIYWIIEIYCFL